MAASIYGELRGSQLSPKLRAEAAYKLGLCHVQTKNVTGVIEAFTYYIQTFPDSPEIPAAMGQRALAYEQSKNYTGALNELNIILAKYPKAREREADVATKSSHPGTTGKYQGHGRRVSPAAEGIPQELCGGAGAILHRQGCVRGEGL